MKRVRIYAVSLLCILFASAVFVSWLASGRIIRAYNYGAQFAAAAKASESSTNLSLVMYGDPQTFRQGLDLFQYVAAQNIEWRGVMPNLDPQGHTLNVDFKLGSVTFQKRDENNFNGTAGVLNATFSVDDLLSVVVRADKVEANITFWTYLDMFPAANITGVLTGNVYVKLSFAVLPIPGLDFAMYEYSGDRFAVSTCIMKPMNLIIETPSNGERVGGDFNVRALIQAVPAISVENVWCSADWGENQPMQYNASSDRWEGVLHSENAGNGGYGVNVHAEGVVWKSGQAFRYPANAGVRVEVNNPWVNSFMTRDWGLEMFNGLKVKLNLDSKTWTRFTTFNFWPSVGLNLEAQEFWGDGNMRFNCWRIDDEQGTPVLQSDGLTLTVTQDVANWLFDGGGKARELKCIYVPNQS